MPVMTLQEVAAAMRVSETYVRDHADELGGVRLPGGRLLRFHSDRIAPYLPTDTIPAWQDADPESPSPIANAMTPTASDGESTARSRNARSTTKTKRTTQPRPSVSAFARDFPDLVHIAR